MNKKANNVESSGVRRGELIYSTGEHRIVYANPDYPLQTTETQLFDMAFAIIDGCFRSFGYKLQQLFRSSKDSISDKEGKLDLRKFTPLFKMFSRKPGYFSAIRNIGQLLENGSKRTDIRDELNELIRLADEIVAKRAKYVERMKRNEYDLDVIERHGAALEHWRRFVRFIKWIIKGRKGAEPEFLNRY